MVKGHLTEIRKLIEAAAAKADFKAMEDRVMDPNNPSNFGHLFTPIDPDPEWNSTVGRMEPEPDRCAWVCPTTCLNCGIENCVDRLAGGPDAI